MGTVLFYVFAIVAFFVAMFLLERFIWEPKRRREAEAAPRITLEEVQSFWSDIENNALPIAKATVQKRAPLSAQESRIGGAPLAIGNNATWPRDETTGFPFFLVAQINFAEMPPLEGFPESGMLQIFSSFEMTDPIGCKRVIRWEPNPQTEELLGIPDEIQKTTRQTKDFSETARRIGLPLVFAASTAPGNPYNWPFEENDPTMENRLPENEEVDAILEDWDDRTERILTEYGNHWVGGQPSFVQYDVREEYRECRSLDRVLFHLGYDDDINLGDGGLLNLMISRDALLQRNFEKAYLFWDCS